MNVNRIFCIGRNYTEHIQELGHALDDRECVVFMKPRSSLLTGGAPIALPRGRGAVHHEAELVVMVDDAGRDVPVERARQHVVALALGLDLTLRDLQAQLKSRGAPWELAKAFDGSAPVGAWQPFYEQDLQAIEFTCSVNGELRQHGRTADMLFPVARQIHILSQTWALQAGDIIFTGTPKGVGPLAPGDRVVLESPTLGRSEWPCR